MRGSSNDRVCLITGVGPGTGSALVRRFAEGGYRVAMLARSGDRLQATERDVAGTSAFPCDLADASALATAVDMVTSTLGAPSVVIHNAVAASLGRYDQVEPDDLEGNFRVNVTALLMLARALVPAMIAAGDGALMVTGNTAAHRGKPDFIGFAPTKAAQRVLAQALARDFGPKGVHVAYLTIDGVIDVPWSRERFADKPDEFFAAPAAIAEEVWRLAHQPRSAWSFDAEVRPFAEPW